jgi:polynucleotide 5'-kinase involved in rRNA processing
MSWWRSRGFSAATTARGAKNLKTAATTLRRRSITERSSAPWSRRSSSGEGCDDFVIDPLPAPPEPNGETEKKLHAPGKTVVIVGTTGTGKSFMSTTLAQGACRHGMRALFVRVPRGVKVLAVARASGTYAATLARIAKVDVWCPTISLLA